MSAHEMAEEARELREVLLRVTGCIEKLEASCQSCSEGKVSGPHAEALRLLYDHRECEHGIPMSELVEQMSIDQSNVSRLCARMERDGELERARCPKDARVRRIALTDRGVEIASELDDRAVARFAELIERLEPQGRADLRRGLAALEAALVGCERMRGCSEE